MPVQKSLETYWKALVFRFQTSTDYPFDFSCQTFTWLRDYYNKTGSLFFKFSARFNPPSLSSFLRLVDSNHSAFCLSQRQQFMKGKFINFPIHLIPSPPSIHPHSVKQLYVIIPRIPTMAGKVKCPILWCHFLYPVCIRIGQQDSKCSIDSVFCSHNLHIGFDAFFYNKCLIVSRW